MAEKGTRKRSVLLFDGDRSAIYGSSGNRYITRAAGRQTGWLAGWLVGRVEASCVSFENLISLIKVLAWRGTSPPFPSPPLLVSRMRAVAAVYLFPRVTRFIRLMKLFF